MTIRAQFRAMRAACPYQLELAAFVELAIDSARRQREHERTYHLQVAEAWLTEVEAFHHGGPRIAFPRLEVLAGHLVAERALVEREFRRLLERAIRCVRVRAELDAMIARRLETLTPGGA